MFKKLWQPYACENGGCATAVQNQLLSINSSVFANSASQPHDQLVAIMCVVLKNSINAAAKRITVARPTYKFVQQPCGCSAKSWIFVLWISYGSCDRRTNVVLLPWDVYDLSAAIQDCEILRQKKLYIWWPIHAIIEQKRSYLTFACWVLFFLNFAKMKIIIQPSSSRPRPVPAVARTRTFHQHCEVDSVIPRSSSGKRLGLWLPLDSLKHTRCMRDLFCRWSIIYIHNWLVTTFRYEYKQKTIKLDLEQHTPSYEVKKWRPAHLELLAVFANILVRQKHSGGCYWYNSEDFKFWRLFIEKSI